MTLHSLQKILFKRIELGVLLFQYRFYFHIILKRYFRARVYIVETFSSVRNTTKSNPLEVEIYYYQV